MRIGSTSGCGSARGGSRPPRATSRQTSLDAALVEHAPWCRTAPNALPIHIKPLRSPDAARNPRPPHRRPLRRSRNQQGRRTRARRRDHRPASRREPRATPRDQDPSRPGSGELLHRAPRDRASCRPRPQRTPARERGGSVAVCALDSSRHPDRCNTQADGEAPSVVRDLGRAPRRPTPAAPYSSCT